MKVLMFYETAPEAMPKAMEHFAAHRARLEEFHRRGVLLMAGPYGVPPVGALGVFTDRAAAQEFVQGDPFVEHGVVSRYELQDWNEVLAP
ncbi:YciI family protein [Curvibacter sp. APW13]|uniref:YciI family protein n=1 Tax=Curvibacter sp. APW13 TaxID=3077236 RepID=UPI0028DE7F73|nr:YciI family protein [Curvibacter sp. APW13]MDT8991933.1 YciI family protein [Curvibacter sp. APW13]